MFLTEDRTVSLQVLLPIFNTLHVLEQGSPNTYSNYLTIDDLYVGVLVSKELLFHTQVRSPASRNGLL